MRVQVKTGGASLETMIYASSAPHTVNEWGAVVSNGISPAENQSDHPERSKRYDAHGSAFLTMPPE